MRRINRGKNYNFTKIAYLWLEEKQDIKIQTYQKYENLIKGKIAEFIGSILIDKITKKDITIFFDKMKENSISISLQKTMFYIIKSSITYAYNKGLCDYLDLKDIKFKLPNKSIQVFSKEEQTIIENKIKEKMNIRKLCLLLSLYTGLRIGEVCGLKWEDINFNSNYLEVKRTIQRIKNKDSGSSKTMLIASTPKSISSNRIIPIPSFIIEYLKQYKTENNYYILSNSTELYDPRYYEEFYKRFLKKCGINDYNFHRVRHSFSTRAIESKMDIKTLSEILGHSSVEITLKLYVHPSYELKKASIENLVNFMAIS